jgi:hypothetical protein
MVWCKELWRELTGPRAEVIVGGGLAFMGTYAGSLYAWDASTGAEKCVFKTGGPIGHSLVFSDGTVFVGSMDRSQGQLFCTHQGNFGAFNLKTGLIGNLFGKRDSYGGFHGGANFGWESQSGCEQAKAAGQPYGLVNQWHGPARAIVSVADKKIYFPVGSQVICLEGAP